MRIQPNTLYYDDCKAILEAVAQPFADLVYLDPPFNSKRDYNVLFEGSALQQKAFVDTWKWGEVAEEGFEDIAGDAYHPANKVIPGLHHFLGDSGTMAYLVYMADRLAAIKEVMLPTASIYLHCDPTASHYLKVVMDCIFGHDNFLNEFVWWYGGGGGAGKKKWGRKHDTLLYYANGPRWTFNTDAVREPHKWDKGQKRADGSARSLSEGKIPDDVFHHHAVMPWAKERTGWPTQKPLVLLDRIIKASSNDGDLILDPFCGCGTSVVAAQQAGRKWVGMDISPLALDIVNQQLGKLTDTRAKLVGYPTSLARSKAFADADPFKFERWAASRIAGVVPSFKQVGDGGIDGAGITYGDKNAVAVQVKGGGYDIDQVRAFRTVVADIERKGKKGKGKKKARAYGVFITQNKVTTPSHLAEFAKAGHIDMGAERFPTLQFWSIEEYFAGVMPALPTLAEPKSKGKKVAGQKALW